MKRRRKGRIGSSFDDFLKNEGVYNEVETVAVKRVIAWQLEEAMKTRRMSKLQMARRMKTSRSQLDRLLDPSHSGVTLETRARAAQVLGRQIRVELVQRAAITDAATPAGRVHARGDRQRARALDSAASTVDDVAVAVR
ncbi:MAG: helix-turn-helix transcriptional regulator [Sulfuritalea sp.]|nr:helix-turn-helix transcriptional regulator [Sulfuritalea sp.]